MGEWVSRKKHGVKRSQPRRAGKKFTLPASCPLLILPGIQLITHAVYGADYLFAGEAPCYFFPQVLHMRVDRPVITFKIIPLNDINQLVSRENPVRVAHQSLEKIILTGC